jgi:hypothetical protein
MDSKLSVLWQSIQKDYREANFDEKYIENFLHPKKGDPKPKFASWSPIEPTYRYFKSFLYLLAEKQDEEFYEFYNKLGNVDLGNPLYIRYRGVKVNLESYTSIEEVKFLTKNVNVDTLKNIVEIGAGYGRTAFALLKLFPNIESYQIIDLPETFDFGSKFLKYALPEHLHKKIHFIDYREAEKCAVVGLDLAFNVDGFHAMPKSTIEEYKNKILSNSRFVYVKNSVCKYPPECIGLEKVSEKLFENGLMTEIGDIYDDDNLNKYRELYCQRYLPSNGWKVIANKPSCSFPFFHHVLYESN